MAEMDARYIGVFMLLSTQVKWAQQVLDPSTPDPTVLTNVGLDRNFVKTFHGQFTDNSKLALVQAMLKGIDTETTMSATMLRLFDTLATVMATVAPNYSPPPCPKTAMPDIIKAINGGAAKP